MSKLIVCSECGEIRPHAAHGLCHVCYEKTRIIVCSECGETKRRAARGVCHACYSRIYRRDQGRVERVAIRAERRRVLADQRAKEAAERALRRCATCGRLLILTRGVVHHRARFCDSFCLYHHPSRRASRGSTRWFSTVKTKLEARQAQARQVEGMR